MDHAEAAEKRPDFLRPSRGVEFPGGASVVPGQPDNREGNGFDLIILNKLAGKGPPPNVVIIRIFRRNSIGVTPWAFATSSVYAD